MNNECGAQHIDANGITYWCNLSQSHLGPHRNDYHRRTWPRVTPFYEEPEKLYALKLTLTDLKVLSFFMSVSGVEQAPETAAKIDEALKEML